MKEYHNNHREKILQQQREWHQKHREEENKKLKVRSKKIRKRNKFLAINHYSNGKMECSCCGEKHIEFLTIDHISGGGNKHRNEMHISHMYDWLVKNNFPEGFQVLCYNCNCSKGFFGYCPHKK